MNVEKGYVDEPIEEGIDLREEILRLKRERNAVIMAHYYQREEIQQLADYIGDSLALRQRPMRRSSSCAVFTSWARQPRSCVPTRRSSCPT